MKRIVFAAIVLALATMACGLSRVTPQAPTAVPIMPTQAPVEPTQPQPTALPPQPTTPPVHPTKPEPTKPEPAQPTQTSQTASPNPALPYFTHFDTNDMGWDTGTYNQANLLFEDGQFVFEVMEPNWEVWSVAQDLGSVQDVVVEIDAQRLSGPEDGQYGVICGYGDNRSYTALAVGEDGYAEIYRFVDNEYESLASTFDAPMNPGALVNLRATCLTDYLALEVDGIEVLSSTQGVQAGSVGLTASVYDTPNLEVGFGFFNVTSYDESQTSADPALPTQVEGSYLDDFSADSGNWDLTSNPDFEVTIERGELRAAITTPYLDISLPYGQPVSGSVRVELDGRWITGDKMVAYGIICGQTEDIYYGLNITETGYAEVFRWKEGVRTPIWERNKLSAIVPGWNTLAAECSGHDLRFFVNGEMVAELREYFEIDGGVGVIVGSYASGNVTVAVDNFTVTSLSE